MNDFCSISAGAGVGDGDGIATPGKAAEFLLAGSPEYHTGHCFLGGILGWNTLAGLASGTVSGSSRLRVAMETPLAGEEDSFFLWVYIPGGGALHGRPDNTPDLGRYGMV